MFKNQLINIKLFFIDIIFLIISSVLCALSQPNYLNVEGSGLIVFIALVPCFYALKRSSCSRSFLYGFIYGAFYYFILNYWLKTFHPLSILIVPFIRAFQFGLLFVVLHLVDVSFKNNKCIILSLTYTSYMFLLEQGFLGYSYGNIAYALYRHLVLIQVADLFGIWLIVFFIVLPQFLIVYEDKSKTGLILFISLFVFIIIYGFIALKLYGKNNDAKQLNVLVIQHNENSHINGFESYISSFNTLTRLTEEGIKEYPNTDLVTWSETAFVPPIYYHQTYKTDKKSLLLVDSLISFSFNLGKPLLLGNGDARLVDEKDIPSLNTSYYYNASLLLDKGVIKGIYRKNHLVPFTEYFPYASIFPRFYSFLLSKDFNFWTPGNELNLFNIKKDDQSFVFYTPICFEDTFAYLSREGVKTGAEFLINLTNDSWSGEKSAEQQHLSIAVFRSIENRVPTVRSTNSGASCLIKKNGDIKGLLPYFKECYGFYSVDIPKKRVQTLYTKLGDMPIKIVSLFTLILIIFQNVFNCIHNFRNRRTWR